MFSARVPENFLLRHFMAFGDSLQVLDYAHFDELFVTVQSRAEKRTCRM